MTMIKSWLLLAPIVSVLIASVQVMASFPDVEQNHPFADAIKYVQDNNIVEGYPDGTFRPDKTINRAEFTKIIIEASPLGDEAIGGNCFPDVKNEWFAKYVCTAYEAGIIQGYPDGTFKPDQNIVFVEAAKIIVNTLLSELLQEEGSQAWYRPYVEALAGKYAIPVSISSYDKLLTRGEMAEIVYRLLASITSKLSLNADLVQEAFNAQVNYMSGDLTLSAYLCKPAGSQKFPAVMYNHGGKEGEIGGAPEETCAFLAESGHVGFAPIRREELSFDNNLLDVENAFDYLKALDYVDQSRLGMIGFSRGGALSLNFASESQELKALVIMASAPTGVENQMDSLVAGISAPVLLMVAENDTPSALNGWQDLVEFMQDLQAAFENVGKNSSLIIYPSFEDNGHLMFFELGDYTDDLKGFLDQYL